MKKILLYLGLLIVGLFLISCASKPGEETNFAGEAISIKNPVIGCKDSDGGKVPEVLGRLQVTYKDGTIKPLVDQCKNAKVLYERFCTGVNPRIMNVNCANGCVKGICKESLTTCTGTAPTNAQLCSGDDTGLTAATPRTIVAACTDAKCEYTCASRFSLQNGSKCDLIINSSCTSDPSCNSINYYVSSFNASDSMNSNIFSNVYVCSVKEELRSQAQCPRGGEELLNAGRASWYGRSFSCLHPKPSSLSNPCPVGFTYNYYPGGNSYQYYCLMPGEPNSTGSSGICNQCGSMDFGGNSDNGDIFCGVR